MPYTISYNESSVYISHESNYCAGKSKGVDYNAALVTRDLRLRSCFLRCRGGVTRVSAPGGGSGVEAKAMACAP